MSSVDPREFGQILRNIQISNILPLHNIWTVSIHEQMLKSKIVPKFSLVIGSHGKLVGMAKGLDMSSCLLLPSYVSIAARKRGRLTKFAGECHLKSWRIRGACQSGPDSPICTWILGSRYFRKDCCGKLNLLLCHRNNIVFQVKLKTILVPEKCKHQSSTPNMPLADVTLHG